ncbi:MAG TPA: ABC transporter substrate-binding protein [Myxococcota bacterium]|nr:ABC transporter substrate-binding protein [Myxococcota bacterium]
MRTRHAFSAVLAAAALLALGASAPEPGPREVVASTVDQVLAVLKDDSIPVEVRRDRIVAIAYERFDFDTMSKLVLAKYWKRFDAGQREAFLKEFKDFLAHRYGDRIDRYDQEKVAIVGERSAKGGDAIVATRIERPSGAPVEVDYRLRSRDGVWRVIDVKIEGISLVSNYRDQFHAVLSQGSPDDLLAQLRKRNAAKGGGEG